MQMLLETECGECCKEIQTTSSRQRRHYVYSGKGFVKERLQTGKVSRDRTFQAEEIAHTGLEVRLGWTYLGTIKVHTYRLERK